MDVTITWEDLGWAGAVAGGARVAARDLWMHDDTAPSDPATGHTQSIPPRNVAMLRFSLVPA